jgi:anti-sigma-K factor RskA
MSMSTDDRNDLLIAEALDTGDASDRRRVRELLASDSSAETDLTRFKDSAALVGQSLESQIPAPDLRSLILDRIDRIEQSRTPLPVTAMPVPSVTGRGLSFDDLLPWVAVFLLAITSAWLWLQNSRARSEIAALREARLASSTLRAAVLFGQNDYTNCKAEMVFCTKMQRGRLVIHNLERLNPDHSYQVWLQTDPAKPPVSAGVFNITSRGDSEVMIRPPYEIETIKKVMISLEPAGGVPKAQGPIVLAGSVL